MPEIDPVKLQAAREDALLNGVQGDSIDAIAIRMSAQDVLTLERNGHADMVSRAKEVAHIDIGVMDNDMQGVLPQSVMDAQDVCHLAISGKNGVVLCNADNVQRIWHNWPAFGKDFLWFDEFHNQTFTTYRTGKVHACTKGDIQHMQLMFQRHFGLSKIQTSVIDDAVGAWCQEHVRNEPQDWLNSLVWDGKARIDRFLMDYVGVEPSEYTTAVSRNLWISMVARILRPGCKYDQLPYLKGVQGTLKSTLLEIIGGKWYAIASADPQDKDFFMCQHGKMLLEIAELHSIMHTKADANRVKMVLSSSTDRYRAPYDTAAKDHPRMSVFIGTTNQDKPLYDPTGNRRFWPIEAKKIDLDGVRRDRDQLFAEAVARFKAGASWWEVPEEEAKRVQEDNMEEDAWLAPIDEWLQEPTRAHRGVTVAEVAEGAIGIPLRGVHLPEQRRIAVCLRALGRRQGRALQDGQRLRLWHPPIDDSCTEGNNGVRQP